MNDQEKENCITYKSLFNDDKLKKDFDNESIADVGKGFEDPFLLTQYQYEGAVMND